MAIKINKDIQISDSNVALKDLITSINTINQVISNMKTNYYNGWQVATNSNGDGFKCRLPIFNPNGTTPSVSLSYAAYFDGGGTWRTLSNNPEIVYANKTEICLYWRDVTGSKSIGATYLLSLTGTITCQ